VIAVFLSNVVSLCHIIAVLCNKVAVMLTELFRLTFCISFYLQLKLQCASF